MDDRITMGNWYDCLNRDDPVIHRIEMIRLLRIGIPVEKIAKDFNASPEYIKRLDERFSKHGVSGILSEDDIQAFRSIFPEVIRICTYNLHGTKTNDSLRFRQIAKELSALDPEFCSFQEVINGNGTIESDSLIANLMSTMTGYYYRSHFVHCHLFMEKYPEGIAIITKKSVENIHIIDLNTGLRNGLTPSLQRYALAVEAEIFRRKIVFVSLHLDHESQKIRLAQAEKLLKEIYLHYRNRHYYCYILAGDFNDVEQSPVMNYFRKKGYKDAYRCCHPTGGNTYDTSNPHKRIDYIMVKGRVDFVSAELILNDPELSDHLGVFVVIK